MIPERPGLLQRTRDLVDVLVREIAKFGIVGVFAFAVDVGGYNFLVFGPHIRSMIGHEATVGIMNGTPIRAKVISVTAATLVAWLGNRYWTFRHRRRPSARHELALFAVFNVVGMVIALGCLAFSRYVLGLHSQLADNISGNAVGLVLGTLFRFWAYRTFVFKGDALADRPHVAGASDKNSAKMTG